MARLKQEATPGPMCCFPPLLLLDLSTQKDRIPSLRDFTEWLEYELVMSVGGDHSDKVEESPRDSRSMKRNKRSTKRTTTVLLGVTHNAAPERSSAIIPSTSEVQDKPTTYCPYFNNTLHFLQQCVNFKMLSKEQKYIWIKSNNRYWHLEALHEVNHRPDSALTTL